MLESLEYFFEGIDLGRFIDGWDLPDVAIGSRAKFFDNFVFIFDMLIYLLVIGHQRTIIYLQIATLYSKIEMT